MKITKTNIVVLVISLAIGWVGMSLYSGTLIIY